MPDAKRATDGSIEALFAAPCAGADEAVAADDPALQSFLFAGLDHDAGRAAALAFLANSDGEMARLIEDLVDILISKNVIGLSDFSEAAQAKLNRRSQARGKLGADGELVIQKPLF